MNARHFFASPRVLRRCMGICIALAAGVPPAHAADETKTQYPIVLVHGLIGFDSFVGIDYFYGIPRALQAGGATVYIAQTAVNATEVRGEEVISQLKAIQAVSGVKKFNLIGHSHGGPIVRYVAAVAPELVASATSVAGPNKGTKITTLVRALLPPGSVLEAGVAGLVNVVDKLVGVITGRPDYPENSLAAFRSLTFDGMAAFNAKYPQALPANYCTGSGAEVVNNVRYYSWTGDLPVTNLLDPFDYWTGALSAVHGEANDGLVPVCSTRLGLVLGTYRQNHFDEVNHLLGLVDPFSVNPVTLYRQHAARLKLAGL